MRMDSVTEEKLNKLKEELDDINDKIITLEKKTNKDLWSEDLEELKYKYNNYYSKLEKIEDLSKIKVSSTLKTKAKKPTKPTKGKGTGGRGRGRGKGK